MHTHQLCALTAGVVALLVNIVSSQIGRVWRLRRHHKARLVWEERHERASRANARTLRQRRDKIN